MDYIKREDALNFDMTDYISREAFRQELINTPFYIRCKTTPDLLTTVQDRLNDTLDLLDNFPAADVDPVRHGEWEPSDKHKGYVSCSICHDCYVEPEWVSDLKWNYCPNCGAKMDGGADNGES